MCVQTCIAFYRQAFGFGANRGNGGPPGSGGLGGGDPARRGSHINVNVAPPIMENDTPEIRKYKKRFSSDILCAALWGRFKFSLCDLWDGERK